ncbi:MAG TPA: polyhydroxyalkanoate depolymerase [Planctomycetes bacterium]|nr:polyhydroxyalkanoate depolymerase [Planctomycetota bacterium]
MKASRWRVRAQMGSMGWRDPAPETLYPDLQIGLLPRGRRAYSPGRPPQGRLLNSGQNFRGDSMKHAFLLTPLLLSMVVLLPGGETLDDRPGWVLEALQRAGENGRQLETALTKVKPEQQRGLHFLLENMPDGDLRTLDSGLLLENVEFAYRAWENSPWKERITEDLFLNHILPYANINERRDRWRKDFFDRFMPLVSAAKTPSEAAVILNQKIFPMVKVKYSTQRPKPDQSPYESIEAGTASCTGLSVLLIDACRAVGVPARFVGTPLWSDGSGNHSWVEIWDDGWHFTGAAEATGDVLDRAWFTDRASKASREDPRNGIYAVSFKRTPQRFPMVWNPDADFIHAVDVTDRYTEGVKEIPEGKAEVRFRAYLAETGDRCRAEVVVLQESGEILYEGTTRDERFDANDHLTVILPIGSALVASVKFGDLDQQVAFIVNGDEQLIEVPLEKQEVTDPSGRAVASLEKYLAGSRSDGSIETRDFSKVPLSREDADRAARAIWQDHAARIMESRSAEMKARVIEMGSLKMPFSYTVHGDPPVTGRSLWISLHGGGGAPAKVNDQQWENQKRLYQPEEGVYLAPRAPTNSWNMWHQANVDDFLDRIIENLIVFEQVDPNHVYLLGYSAGGDGVYQVGPRMADRWAAAAMMAGHPNDARPDSLRNTAFTIHIGGKDNPYNRNGVAREWQQKLADLQDADPEGYRHWVKIYEEKGHWMDSEDSAALPWMAQHTRNLRPEKLVWQQDDVTHDRFYWLEEKDPKPRSRVVAEIDGQKVRILEAEGVTKLTILLDDSMLNLDEPVFFEKDGRPLYECSIDRTIATIARTMKDRGDPIGMFSAEVTVEIPEKENSE